MSHNATSMHHRRPKSLGGTDNVKNLSTVDSIKHDAWHRIFKNMTPEAIAYEINRVWIDPQYQFVVVKKGK